MKGVVGAIITVCMIFGCAFWLFGHSEYATVPVEDARYKVTCQGNTYYVDSYTLDHSVILHGYYYIAHVGSVRFKEEVRYSSNTVIIEAGLVEIEDRMAGEDKDNEQNIH